MRGAELKQGQGQDKNEIPRGPGTPTGGEGAMCRDLSGKQTQSVASLKSIVSPLLLDPPIDRRAERSLREGLRISKHGWVLVN
jgi:hypothetical protein